MTLLKTSRLEFIHAHGAHVPETLCQIVDEGLSQPQKSLPCRYFYDRAGSQLFEQICSLPEYYVTRTEQAILERSAGEMLEAAGRDLAVVEFGSGSSHKTRILLDAALRRQPELRYVPIDISTEFLRDSTETLLEEYPGLRVMAIAGEYRDGIEVLPTHEGPRLVLFLGSNIGNFEDEEAVAFLGGIRRRMELQDRLLVGIDLVKDRGVLFAAYNDSAGITAQFNKNLLYRINHELGGRFQVGSFEHHAPYVEERSRIEMRLISRVEQTVGIAATDREYRFEAGEFIHTENSHKYTLERFGALCRRAGLTVAERWLDSREWFAVMLLQPA